MKLAPSPSPRARHPSWARSVAAPVGNTIASAMRAPPADPWAQLLVGGRYAVLGLSGSGKTWEAKAMTRNADRVVYFDPCDDYGDVAEPVRAYELAELLRAPRFAYAVRPVGDDETELAAEAELVISLVRAARNAVIVLDELGDYSESARKPLSRLARNGRHSEVTTLFVTQAATEIPKAARRQLTHVVSFIQVEPDDLRALSNRCGAAFAAAVSSWQAGDPPSRWVLPSLAPRGFKSC